MGSYAISSLSNIRLDNGLGGFLCLNIMLFDHFHLLTL